MSRSKGREKGRKQGRSRPTRRILIICEDTKSSRDYFALFPVDKGQVEVECVGTGANTDSLMLLALSRADGARKAGAPYERIWVVFDRDSFPLVNFNRAFDLAGPHLEVTPCWSNECFELWYLLHFHYRDTPIDRHQLGDLLGGVLGKKYDRADATLWHALRERLPTAIRNASRLEFQNRKAGTSRGNPSTLVHQLVVALMDLDPDRQRPN